VLLRKDGGRTAPRFLPFRQFRYALPEQIAYWRQHRQHAAITLRLMIRRAGCAHQRPFPKNKARRPTESTCGPVAGWGEQKLLRPAILGGSGTHCSFHPTSPANVTPGAPGQKRIARTSPFPEIRTAGQQRAISKARSGSVAGVSTSLLGRQAATPVTRQRTSRHQPEPREASPSVRLLACPWLFSTARLVAQIVPVAAGNA
jgi:hypothetical protein